jgi:hypothetical protein
MIPFIYKIFRRIPSPSPIPEKIPSIHSLHPTKEIDKISDLELKKKESTHPISEKLNPRKIPKEVNPPQDEFSPHSKEEETKPSLNSKLYDSHFINHESQPEKPIPDIVLGEIDSHRTLASMQFKIDLPTGSFIHCLLHWDPPVQNAWIQISSENMDLLGNFSQIKHRLIDDIKNVGFLEVHFEIVYE